MNSAHATLFVVDDDLGSHQGLYSVMQSAGLRTASFASAEEFLDSYAPQEPGCVLLERNLPGMGGLALMEAIKSRHDAIAVIVMTSSANVPAAVQSMKLGAFDFISKPVDPQVLLASVKAAVQAQALWRRNMETARDAQLRVATLTHREQEILMGLTIGKSSKQIAAETGLSPRTVENHRAHVLAKTGARNVAHAVRIGMLASIARWAARLSPMALCCTPFPPLIPSDSCELQAVLAG